MTWYSKSYRPTKSAPCERGCMVSIPSKKEKVALGAKIGTMLHSAKFQLILMAVLCSAVLLMLFLAAITPIRYDLSIGMVPTHTIPASKDVVDEITTQRNRLAASDAVPPTYKYQDGVTEQVLTKLEHVKTEFSAVTQYAKTLEDYTANKKYSDEELQYASTMLSTISMRDYQLQSLLNTSQEDLDALFESLTDTILNTMQGNVTQGQESTAINSIMQIIGYRTDINILQNIASPVLRAVIMPNMVVDQAATEEAKKAAMAAIDPVIYKQGQNIVVRGEGRIRESQIRMLNSLGLLSNDEADYSTNIGAIMLMVVTLLVFHMVLYGVCRNIATDMKRLFIIYIVMFLSMLLCIAAKLIDIIYLAPLLLASMLLSVTLGHLPALITNAALSILLPFLLTTGGHSTAVDLVHLVPAMLVGGSIAALLLRNNLQRGHILIGGLLASAAGFLVILGTGIMVSNDTQQVLRNAAWAVVGGILSSLLSLGFQPMLEFLFNLPTQSRLLDLSNPTQPLLHRLLTEAPGTYHHSIIIANLAEASAEAIGANPLLARVGGYYHDIGKLKRPHYFKENQFGQANIHDETDTKVSAAIITSHIRDGLSMARQYRLPPEVQSIISEHHGNSLVMYFYSKAMQHAPGSEIDQQDYRYDGIPPTSAEGAIVMLCDTIEAAIRSLSNPTRQEINDFITRLIQKKLEDGQLANAPLTMRDLDKIAQACATVLYGVFHERIEYPDVDKSRKKLWADPRGQKKNYTYSINSTLSSMKENQIPDVTIKRSSIPDYLSTSSSIPTMQNVKPEISSAKDASSDEQ